MKVDLEKLICSFLKGDLTDEQKIKADEMFKKNRFVNAIAVKWNLVNALKQQGLEYKDGAIKSIESMPEFKEGDILYNKDSYASDSIFIFNCCIVPISDQDNWELEKPSTIKFEPDIDAMVKKYKKGLMNNIYLDTCWHKAYCETYRQGLEDMYKRLKG